MSEKKGPGAKIKRVVLKNGQIVVTGTRNLEYELVVSLNHETAQKIMEAAGIDKNNPNYKAYYAQAMAAAHHSRRFNGDEEAMIKLFAKEMQKPDMTPDKLKNFERNYRNYVVEQQQKYATGSTFDNRDESAPTIDKNIRETVRSGVELREKINPTFPDIMYDDGVLTDVVLDLSDEARGNSAIGIINDTVEKYDKYGIKFDAESNQFQVKGKPVNVQKFYSSKKNQMDKFLANLEKAGGFDASDKELFEVIEAGDYQKFLELKKQRGGQDKRNMFLRNALNDEILFDRFCEEVKGKEHSLDNVTETAKILSEDYGSKSDIISKESERGKITSATTGDLKAGEIDRIVFSAKPFQVASQSTYQNWKSCMNAVGCNHRYVDDSIGQGSIVAYGYNSKNPQNKISRLLIHPWINEKGETLYVVNDKIYGESNSAFQNVVGNFTESLNQGKEGVFRFNANALPYTNGLYNDDLEKNTILRGIEGRDLDLSHTKNLELSDVDLSQVKSVIKLPESVKLTQVTLGDNVDFSNVKNLELFDVDLSQVKSVKLPESVSLNNVILGDNVDFSNVKDLKLSNFELSQAKLAKFPENVKLYGGTLGDDVDLSNVKNLELFDVDLSQAKSVKLPESVKLTQVTLGDNVDFSNVKNLELSNFELSQAKLAKFPESVKFRYGTELVGDLDFSNVKNLDLSGVDLSQANIVKFPESIKLGNSTEFNGNIDLSSVKNIEVSDLSDIDKFNISSDANIKLGKEVEIRKKEDLITLKRCDTSETKVLFFDEKILSEVKDAGIEFPADKILGFERNGEPFIVCDEKGRSELIKDFSAEEINGVNFISPEEFSQKEGVKFESKTAETQAKSQEADVKQQEPEVKTQEPDLKTTELKETLKQQAEGKRVDNGSSNPDEVKVKEPKAKTTGNEDSSKLHETLKEQTEAANQTKNVSAQTPPANGDLHSSLKNQKANSGLGGRVSAISNGLDDALEKIGNKVNDNAVGRTIGKIDSWRPHNKIAAKAVDKVGVVPVAAVVASGVSAYEQYKSGDKKGAAATMVKGTAHAVVQGVATSGGMNLAAKGVAKGTEKVVTKVVERNLTKKAVEKVASKAVVKAGAKAAGKAAGKAILKKVPFVSLAAGAYFAYERAKNGEWGKAGCEILSGAAGCVPFVGTIASTAIDCGLAVDDTRQAIKETKKQQAAEQAKKEQTQKPQQNKVSAQRLAELRNTKPGQSQKKPAPAKKQQKPIEKGVWDKFTDLFSR